MGLDMMAFAIPVKPSKEIDIFEYRDDDNNRYIDGEVHNEELEELFYWRKHPNLHGWMERLYYKKGGTEDDGLGGFNSGQSVVLTSEDLDNLESDIKADNLPFTSGFFFGKSPRPNSIDLEEQEWYLKQQAEDLEFVEKARRAIEEGKTVYYTSWW